MPDGLVLPNPPTFTQKFERGINALFGLVETTAEAAPGRRAAAMPSPTPAGLASFDFDGDGKTDYAVWHASSTTFTVKPAPSATPVNFTLGSGASVPAPGDFDGDGKTDVAVYSAGQWAVRLSSESFSTAHSYSFGQAGDVPVVADYDGDGKTDMAVWRPSTGYFGYRKSTDSSDNGYQFGAIGDIPVVGNFDGDSKADFAVFRQSTGYWYIQQSNLGYLAIQWGQAGDVPVPGDYDGDGKTDPAVFRGSTGYWYMLKSSSSGYSDYTAFSWGGYGDEPVPGDYDGDGITDIAIWRATTGDWWVTKNSDSTYYSTNLGVSGDRSVPSAYLKQIGGHVTGYDVAPLRLSPKQATGGTNYYSQNFGWGRTLVSLLGRSGLDAAFGISYNSLVWLKDTDNATIYFDPDAGNIGPGFRFGFPVIEQAYYDSAKSTFCYIMVTPDGGRKEFRQTAVSNVYEAADSSYTQIELNSGSTPNDVVTSLTPILKTTDGTQMTFEWKGTAFHAKEIKDRNGNYITITNDDDGLMTQVTDTLGREINIDYDDDLFPTAITQTWKASNGSGSTTTHTWATFSYSTKALSLSFSGLTVVGPISNASIKVLDHVTYADGSYTKFTYNSFGQVYEVQNYAANDDELNHEWHNINSPGSNLTDCPRFTQTKTFAKDFNSNSEVTFNNSIATGQSYTLPDSSSATGTLVKIKSPNGEGTTDALQTWIYSNGSGWGEGLPILTEDYDTESSTLTRKRWTWNGYTQDDSGLAYILNPRVVETRIGDGTNTKRTTIDYYEPSTGVFPYGLPETVKVYDTDLSTVLKTQKTAYKLDSAYTSRRIIGLPEKTELWEGTTSGTLMSKVTYAYDEGSFGDSSLVQNIAGATQHDDTGYPYTFVTGRGLLTSTTRCDASLSGSTTCNGGITSSVKYNTAGSPVAKTDPLSHVVRIGYTDSFNSSVTGSTYAYPTTVTDPAGSSLGDASHSTTMVYRFDTGANVETVAVPRSGSTVEKKAVSTYNETTGRVAKQALWNKPSGTWQEHSYTRYEYPDNGRELKVYRTLVDADNDGPDTGDEALTDTWFDGAGRPVRSRTPHPGSTGGWAAVLTDYDILGRVHRQSVPTEVSVNGSTWTAAGDDSTRDFKYNYAYYDWKGRTVRTLPSDSNGSDGKDTLISYAGCGCAGGQVTTVQGPVTTAVDAGGTTRTTKRRTQKSYEDILGRTYKTEIWDLDGEGSAPYSTVKTTFNGRDQATLVRQYDGSDSSSTYQDSTMSYDGFGRAYQTHKPEQAAGRYTSFSYNADDSVHTMTDGRGVVTTYGYEERGLVDEIAYTLPTDNEAETPWMHEIDKSGTSTVTLKGGGFATNVEVLVGVFDGSTWTTLETFSGGGLSRGTSGSYQTITFTITNSTAVYDLLNTGLYIHVKNTDTGQMSEREYVLFAGSQTVANGHGVSDAPAAAATVSFEYDQARNRTSMTDAVGSVAYSYDSLSQLASETRTFTDITSRTFTTSYAYQIGGGLKTITDPFDAVVTYSYQLNGRLSQVSGTGYEWSDPFVSNMSYRAWGALKQADYGNGSQLNMTFDTALRPTEYAVTQSTTTRGTDYEYYNDGRLRLASDLADDRFDKAYKYDFADRLKEASSGFDARGESNPDSSPIVNRPYKQSFTYDAFDNRIGGEHKFWRTDYTPLVSRSFQNNRETTPSVNPITYDADGRPSGSRIDAAGKPVEYLSSESVGGYPTVSPMQPSLEIRQKFDVAGDGTKRELTEREEQTSGGTTSVVETTTTTYELRSAVLGNQVVTEIKPDGTKKAANVYANGQRIAEYKNLACTSACPQSTNIVEMNPLTGSGFRTYGGSGGNVRDERDPQGANTGTEDPWLTLAEPMFKDLYASQEPFIEGGGNAMDPNGGCEIDGVGWDCNDMDRMADRGTLVAAEYHRGAFYRQHAITEITFGGHGSGTIFIAGSNNADPPFGVKDDGRAWGTEDVWLNFRFSGRVKLSRKASHFLLQNDEVTGVTMFLGDKFKALVGRNNKSSLSDEMIMCDIAREAHHPGAPIDTVFTNAQGSTNHRGFMQVGPKAAEDIGVGNGIEGTDKQLATANPDYMDVVYHAGANIRMGTAYLELLIKRARGNVKTAFRNYRGVPGDVYFDSIEACAKKVANGDLEGGLRMIYPQGQFDGRGVRGYIK